MPLDDAGISRIVNRCEKEYRLPEGSEDCSSSPLIRGHGQDTQHTDTSQTTRVQEETLGPSSCALAKHSTQTPYLWFNRNHRTLRKLHRFLKLLQVLSPSHMVVFCRKMGSLPGFLLDSTVTFQSVGLSVFPGRGYRWGDLVEIGRAN